MMHKWESTEKLLPQWETQDIGDKKFDYEDFKYKHDEFDNVPPVVPRFLFFLQLNMKPVADFILNLSKQQTVPSLKEEIKDWVTENRTLIDESEVRSKARDDALEAKIKDLQRQIDEINKKEKDKEEEHKKAALQTLWDDDSFKFDSSKFTDQFENKKATYTKNLESDAFKKPRMLSLQQIRNSFFAMINQSYTRNQIEDLQSKSTVLIRGQEALEKMDEKLEFKIKDNYAAQQKDLSEFREEFTTTQRTNEKNNAAINSRVQECLQKLSNHQDRIEDCKRSLGTLTTDVNKMANKVESLKKDVSENIQGTKDELNSKVEGVEQFCTTNFEIIKEHSNKDRHVFQNAMTALKDELSTEMHKETETLQNYVLNITNKSSAHRETLQEKYDEKIERIKDVCASYFSKYEKHLLQQQELMKTLEQRQEDWINTLLKPQELNQARLYAIDSRLNENDKLRLEDCQFNKDTLKKLIFAMEQHLSALSQNGGPNSVGGLTQAGSPPQTANQTTMGNRCNSAAGNRPPRSQRNVVTSQGGARTGLAAPLNVQSRKSVADSNFPMPSASVGNGQLVPYDQNSGQILPSLPHVDSKKGGNGEVKDYGQQPLSFMDLRGQSGAETATGTTSGLSTHDVLFLKRLLFLKATLDNQHQQQVN